MKKLITRTTLFLFPIFILLLSFEYLLRNIPNDYSYKKKYLDDNAEKLEVLILGNSHASYGINPDFIHLAAFNNSHGSQTIDYDYQIFQKYFDKLTRLKYIILPIDYFTLFIRLENGWEEYRKNITIYIMVCALAQLLIII